MTISPAANGFIKGLVLVVILSVTSYLANEANLTGILNPALAMIVTGVASAIESYIKEQTGRGTFGAVAVE